MRPETFRFGPYEVDLEQRLLFRDGDSVPLTPKAFDTLAVLIARPGKIIDKAELLKTVWPDTFVEENNLTQNISALRKVFGDGAYIETIPRRGYRFLARREDVSAAENRHSGFHVESLVVLPFVNLTAAPEDEYFSDGLTEELTNAVAQLDGLRVVARTTAFQFKGKARDIRAIARQIHVGTVLEGSVRRQDKRLRITVQLIDAHSGYHIWSQTYDRDAGDIFSLQDDISNQVARSIRPDGRVARASAGIRDREAFNLYLLGRFHRGKPDLASVKKAMAFFDQAIEKDSGYAGAYAGLAECYMKLAQQNAMRPVQAWTLAQKAVDKALALDDNLAEAHTTQAIVHLLLDRDWEASERQFRRALALNGNDAAAHHWFSHYFTAMGQTSESLAESRIALELDPLDVQISAHMIFHYVRARDFPNAIKAGLETLELDPNSRLAYLFLMWAYEDTEQWDKAIDAAQRAPHSHAEAPDLEAAVRAHGGRGYWRVNQAFLSKQENPDNYRLAICHARLGEADNALARLQRSFEEREPELIYLKRESAFDWIAGHPGFRALTDALKLP